MYTVTYIIFDAYIYITNEVEVEIEIEIEVEIEIEIEVVIQRRLRLTLAITENVVTRRQSYPFKKTTPAGSPIYSPETSPCKIRPQRGRM